jgi:NAD dependent epimerase/dehydratase family enzyme
MQYAIRKEDLSGPVNAVAPVPVTNAEFTKTLGRVLSRPAFLAVPAFAVRLALGEMADELLLASARVEPAALQQSGFQFRYPQLEAALRHVLNL